MTAPVATGFHAPHLSYAELSPILVVLGGACAGVLVEAFLPRAARRRGQVLLTVATLLAALVATVAVGVRLGGAGRSHGAVAAVGSVVVDGPTVYLWGLLLVVALAGTALFAECRLGGGLSGFTGRAVALPGSADEAEGSRLGLEHTEVYPLLLFAVAGTLLLPASGDLLTMFVAVEVLSLPLYLLCGLARTGRLVSQEAALKYFLLGSFSSAFFLYGAALVYGYAGSFSLAAVDAAVRRGAAGHGMLVVGAALLAVGLLFKVGAVPFQSWVPDVYQGAPTPVVAFMSAGTKIAAFGAFLRLLHAGLGGERADWRPVLGVVAIASMLVGTALALVQTDVKRMLAYSSVAHTGFLLAGVLGGGGFDSVGGVLVYLTAYGFAAVGAFALLTVVRDAAGEVTTYDGWTGLGRRSPVVAGAFAFLLLSMAGIPLTAGFVGKWAVLAAALSAGAWPVVVVAVVASIGGVYVYLGHVRRMFFTDAGPGGAAVVAPSPATVGTVAVCVGATLLLGVAPGPELDLIDAMGGFLR